MHLTGSKLGCGEGGCGACTVMVSSYDREEDVIKHVAVNACLTPLCSVAGMAITTVEGIGSTRTSLHPVQVSSYRKSSALHSYLNNLCLMPTLCSILHRLGAYCQSSWVSVWILYSWVCHVHVHSAQEQLHSFRGRN